jgi:hypothetical protein
MPPQTHPEGSFVGMDDPVRFNPNVAGVSHPLRRDGDESDKPLQAISKSREKGGQDSEKNLRKVAFGQ